ncbi:hypothetical protein GWI73_06590 [Proteus sp. G2661]|uniref:NUMOD4 domain-containing protein n=1 Tax=Proteus sp. G2661 TaxID=2698874 RepID=UPI0013770F23|nr:NUMOD4 domain-containing protein [Proteus sp. G2661]NBM85913.1 hypothetical protein [Proteus sp. G2661]
MNNQITGNHYDMNLSLEKWLPVAIPDFSQSYEVSNFGRVRSVDRCTSGVVKVRKIKGKLLKTRMRKDGYLTVNFHFKGVAKQFAVHRLIALTFIKNPNEAPYVNHKNGVKTDNNANNLEWVTPLENIQHAIKTGLMKVARGADNEQFKGTIIATNKKTLKTLNFKGKKSLIEFGFDHSAVYGCVTGRMKSHRGYTFRRVESKAEVMPC